MNNEISRTVRVYATSTDAYGNPSETHVEVTFSRENGQMTIDYKLPKPFTESEHRKFEKYLAEEISKYKAQK